MTVVLLLWRTRLRASWRAALALVVLMGLGGSVALAVAAGARRTASANDAILDAGNASDVVSGFAFEHPEEVGAALRTVPGITDVDLWVGFREGSVRGSVTGSDPAATIARRARTGPTLRTE